MVLPIHFSHRRQARLPFAGLLLAFAVFLRAPAPVASQPPLAPAAAPLPPESLPVQAPLSEVTYRLDGRYGDFQALLGLNADASPNAAAVFLVYAEGVLVFNSGVVRPANPVSLDLCVAGVQRLRLVTAFAGQSASGGWV